MRPFDAELPTDEDTAVGIDESFTVPQFRVDVAEASTEKRNETG